MFPSIPLSDVLAPFGCDRQKTKIYHKLVAGDNDIFGANGASLYYPARALIWSYMFLPQTYHDDDCKHNLGDLYQPHFCEPDGKCGAYCLAEALRFVQTSDTVTAEEKAAILQAAEVRW